MLTLCEYSTEAFAKTLQSLMLQLVYPANAGPTNPERLPLHLT
jgi:hypothetical protein